MEHRLPVGEDRKYKQKYIADNKSKKILLLMLEIKSKQFLSILSFSCILIDILF